VTELRHYLTAQEAVIVRQLWRRSGGRLAGRGIDLGLPGRAEAWTHRIFLPIETSTDQRSPNCRACGEPIARGERCISFMFDSKATTAEPYSWGRLSRAYLHIECEGRPE
jgi:hypothetical protein